jgi:hypothetical protein
MTVLEQMMQLLLLLQFLQIMIRESFGAQGQFPPLGS